MGTVIEKASCGYTKEPLKAAFGFKGSSLTSLWQTSVCLCAEGSVGVGVGVQSVLWSDAKVYAMLGEQRGNEAMLSVTRYAAEQCKGMMFDTPPALFDALFPRVYEYAKEITDCPSLRKTFALNAMVPLDFAAWQLWERLHSGVCFDEISPFDGERQTALANIPLITYHTPVSEVVDMAKSGTPLFKIKIGSNPDGKNDLDAMLAWDKARLLELHQALKDTKTPYTESGHILYYLDANGRYDTKDRLLDLINFAKDHGILERIVLLEEPFDEENKLDVHDLPVTVAADESAHDLEDVTERCALGYRALTLKPIAKTLSLTIRMANYARAHGMQCFCADLTVNPFMVTWNQCVAARLSRIQGMKIGVVESNGAQNYINWQRMQEYHPCYGHNFMQCEGGIFHLGDDFYQLDGGIFMTSEHYRDMCHG